MLNEGSIEIDGDDTGSDVGFFPVVGSGVAARVVVVVVVVMTRLDRKQSRRASLSPLLKDTVATPAITATANGSTTPALPSL